MRNIARLLLWTIPEHKVWNAVITQDLFTGLSKGMHLLGPPLLVTRAADWMLALSGWLLIRVLAQRTHPLSAHMCRCLPSCTCKNLRRPSACDTPAHMQCTLQIHFQRPRRLPDNVCIRQRSVVTAPTMEYGMPRAAACSCFHLTGNHLMTRTTGQ